MRTIFRPLLALTAVFAFASLNAFAQAHPAYLRALTDLRTARAHLERPNHGELKRQEKDAIHEIDETISAIKKAAIDDGKDLNYHPVVDAGLDWTGRIHRAVELISKAHSDIAREEDNRFAQGLQQRAIEHLDKAKMHAEEALAIARGGH